MWSVLVFFVFLMYVQSRSPAITAELTRATRSILLLYIKLR